MLLQNTVICQCLTDQYYLPHISLGLWQMIDRLTADKS